MQNRIILFCYVYLAGIVLAMFAPLDPVYAPVLHVLTALALLAMALVFLWRAWTHSGEDSAPERKTLLFLALLLPALLLGYMRYIDANTVPDTRLGMIRIGENGARLEKEGALPDTCRIRLRKVSSFPGDVRLRLHGRLDARLPILSEEGVPALDAENRWRFRVARVEQQSDVITLKAGDPPGTDYVVGQPFTRLDKVEVLSGPGRGEIEVYRISNHTRSFVRPGRNQTPVTVLGRVTADPLVYGFKTVLPVTPYFIQYRQDGPFYKVNGGTIRVTLQPRISNYEMFARSEAFGYDIVVRGGLSGARPRTNPGGFDARRFLENHNVYGSMTLFEPRGGPPPIVAVAPEGGELRHGNKLVEFSLALRDRMLLVFKQTLPYPQSAFLGAVTLGLRYGLQSARYTLGMKAPAADAGPHYAGEQTAPLPEQLSDDFIFDEFKAAGVNHVLAVSGLHVTIITVLFVGIFTLLKMHRRVYVPFIILSLVIFAIITGARPSTLRAVIMNSLFLLTWAYLGQGLQASVLFGVPVAAFIILLHNPLMIVDPSFTLSFGAILSLALLTEPFHDQLSKLRGNYFLFFLLAVVFTTFVGIRHWHLLVRSVFWVPYTLFWLLVLWWFRRLSKRGRKLFGDLRFTQIPSGASLFLAAQFGIQVGMMIPLSAYYFCRWPFAGAYANLIAIPLIGVVVQLGVVAGLLGFIPIVGPYLALVLNGANWVFSSLFLWLAHTSAHVFPYPFVKRPTLRFLLIYYLFCGAFIWHRPLWAWLKRRCAALGFAGRGAPASIAIAAAVLLSIPAFWPRKADAPGELNITVLSVGYGSSILVESPGGKRILIDGGFVEHERGRRNEAIRTILPFLSHKGIRRLDAMVLTSPLPGRAAGMGYLLDHCATRELFLPEALAGVTPDEGYEDFCDRLAGQHYFSYPAEFLETLYREIIGDTKWTARPSLARALARRHDSLLNRWAGWVVKTAPLRKGTVVAEETVDGKTFRIEALYPEPGMEIERPIENRAAVLRITYGTFSMLLPSDLHYAGQAYLANNLPPEALRSDVFIVPHHGTALPEGYEKDIKGATTAALRRGLGPLLAKVQPDTALFEFGNPRPVLGRRNRDALHVFENTYRFVSDQVGPGSVLKTDRDFAIFIQSDGRGYRVSTQAEQVQAAAGSEDEVSDIEIGF